MNVENTPYTLKKALEEKNLKKAESVFDFINVELYTNPDKYSVKYQHYWLWSELRQELQEYRMVEHFQNWEYFREYVESGICYIKK